MKKKNFELDLLDDPCSIASTTECTGLIQIPPTNEEEAESYGNIYVIPEQINNFDKVKKPCEKSTGSAPRKNRSTKTKL